MPLWGRPELRLLFIADGRSPIAQNWMRYFVEAGHDVHLLTTFDHQPDMALRSVEFCPVAFSGLWKAPSPGPGVAGRSSIAHGARWINLRARVRHWLGPFTIPRAARAVRASVHRIQPDLVHAMRIPYEGMLAAYANPAAPLVLSVWGNDFTLHAPSTPWMSRYTRLALRRADALHTDCRRDQSLARQWGYPEGRPGVVLPGGGGVRTKIFHPGDADLGKVRPAIASMLRSIPPQAPVIVNPRGFRAYVRNDTFFRSIPLLLNVYPDAVFLCPAMEGEQEAQRWVNQLGVAEAVRLLPYLSAQELGEIYRRARVVVSITEHDGIPNSLLEALACGCVPVAGELESIGEWIMDGENGLLVDAGAPGDLALAIQTVFTRPDWAARVVKHNRVVIDTRALRSVIMAEVDDFYHRAAGPGG